VADSVRSEGDTLIVSTRGGNDTIDASALTTDRAALRSSPGTATTSSAARVSTTSSMAAWAATASPETSAYDVFLDASPSASNGVDDDGDGRIDEPTRTKSTR
jgi:hypothetical protein